MADRPESQASPLVESLRALEEKLAASDGIEPLVELLGEIEGLLVNVGDESLDQMRSEIRSVIERLLVINGDMQRIAKLKKILP